MTLNQEIGFIPIITLNSILNGEFVFGGFDIAFKRLRSYRDGAYLYQCAATQECHAADTGHPTSSQYTDTGRSVVVLSIDVVVVSQKSGRKYTVPTGS